MTDPPPAAPPSPSSHAATPSGTQVHLVDGTYELFRYFYSPGGGHLNGSGMEVGAVRGVLRSLAGMLDDGATHIGVATDHVIESFRNEREKVNLLYWQLTCRSFYAPEEWEWIFAQTGYTGDYSYITFE